MSDPSRPHELKPTRLLHSWDFPGKSTGVGCHCLLWSIATHTHCLHSCYSSKVTAPWVTNPWVTWIMETTERKYFLSGPLQKFTQLWSSYCLVTRSCPNLWDPMDCSSPGSSVHVILQDRILEWVAISWRSNEQPDIGMSWAPWAPCFLPASEGKWSAPLCSSSKVLTL